MKQTQGITVIRRRASGQCLHIIIGLVDQDQIGQFSFFDGAQVVFQPQDPGGNAGAGLGATAGTLKGGLGSASFVLDDPGKAPLTIGAVVRGEAWVMLDDDPAGLGDGERDGLLVGQRIATLREHVPNTEGRIAAIYRQGKAMLPEGDTVIQEGDEVFFIADRKDIRVFMSEMRRLEDPVQHVVRHRVGAEAPHRAERAHGLVDADIAHGSVDARLLAALERVRQELSV